MGLLKEQANGREEDLQSDPSTKEEDYEKAFVKIARDFIHKEDFVLILSSLIEKLERAIPGLKLSLLIDPVDLTQNSNAMEKAHLYKEALKGGGGSSPEQLMKHDIMNSKEFCNET